ncbi:MAG TPA: methionine adenosyltransferase [Burkholderiales bacterium]|nr:methionine adenosyltransferase [Burkholderiales bacterium]
MNLTVTPLAFPSPASLPVELVERKGKGHPDTICDALVENLSRELSRFYLDRFGAILHHNVDKGLLFGGAARPAFRGGEVTAPIEIYLTGRATASYSGVAVPLEEIAIEGSRRWIREHLRYLDPERGVRIIPRIRPTSPDLAAMFLRQHQAGAPLANDTSFGVGFAPLDELERVVLAVERSLDAPETAAAHPYIGEDIKVMGLRQGAALRLTVACAVVGRHVADLADYGAKKERIRELAMRAAHGAAGSSSIEIEVNTADGESEDSVYITVTGLSAESGDDGQVGRGNRVNGLITPYRPMSLEAVAGKNPISHVGKLYNLAATRIARAVVAEIPSIEEAYCTLLSQIGRPITDPQLAEVAVRVAVPSELDAVRRDVEQIVRDHLAGIVTLWKELVETSLPLW